MNQLYEGQVHHHRFGKGENEFTYPVYFLELDPASFPENRLFSKNRFNLFSLFDSDYGPLDTASTQPKSATSSVPWVRSTLREAGILNENSHLILITFPRILGYVFNPVSFWVVLESATASTSQQISGVLCEVNNTFGERHFYIVHGNESALPKEFHVSPFYPIKGEYRFKFTREMNFLKFSIHFYNNSTLELATNISGSPTQLNNKNLLSAFFRYPMFTLMVFVRIHLQAFRLWRKGHKIYHKPAPPLRIITGKETAL